VVLVYYWSQIEPDRGSFDWGLVHQQMAPWIAAGKKVVIRVSTSGEASWDRPYSGNGTPPWVYRDGAKQIDLDGETLPVYWSPAYLSDYSAFVTALGKEFNGSPAVSFIEPGFGMGGETLPQTDFTPASVSAWESAGYSDQVWLSTIETISSDFEHAFPSTPVFPLVDRTFFDGSGPGFDHVMGYFRSIPDWGLQDDGLTASQRLNSLWDGRPLALEQLFSTTTTGGCLCEEISNALDRLDGNYLLVYRSDIVAPANSRYLEKAASRVGR
jgi:hypothetical protein